MIYSQETKSHGFQNKIHSMGGNTWLKGQYLGNF